MEIPAAMLPPIVVDGPIPIMSFSEIMSRIDATKSHERIDKAVIDGFLSIDIEDLKSRLIAWGSLGCPYNHVLYTLQFTVLDKCADGVTRGFVEYISYLDPNFSIANILSDLESRLPGMSLSYSYTNTQSICVHVNKT